MKHYFTTSDINTLSFQVITECQCCGNTSAYLKPFDGLAMCEQCIEDNSKLTRFQIEILMVFAWFRSGKMETFTNKIIYWKRDEAAIYATVYGQNKAQFDFPQAGIQEIKVKAI